MRSLLLALLGVSALAAAPSAQSHELDLSFNSDAFRLLYAYTLPQRSLRADGAWLHNSDSGAALHGGLQLVSAATSGPDPVLVGLGGRVVYLNGRRGNQDGLGIAVGGSLRYTIPQYNRFAVTGEAWYAPNVLIGLDTRQYRELAVRGSYNVTRQAEVYVGARHARAKYRRAEPFRFDTGMHLGINLRF
ncbi:MAG: hypothetical protein JJT85_04825 [Chromatiales bacterium]|nr:hypothetical protein [Chromatiales bacterium]